MSGKIKNLSLSVCSFKMGKYAQLVLGPAGCGKSTYCNIMYEHLLASRRTSHVINLDPGAEEFKYPATVNVRDYIKVEDVMESMKLGPNGSLVYCLEYLLQDVSWLLDQISDFDDDYLIIDLPGQIELYTHMDLIRQFTELLQTRLNYHVCCLYLIDSHFIVDSSHFISGSLSALSAMVRLETPHINILTKCDLLDGSKGLDLFLEMDITSLIAMNSQEGAGSTSPALQEYQKKKQKLNAAVGELLDNFSLVRFLPLDRRDEDSIDRILLEIDNATQYGEDEEPKEPDDDID
ncbi:putative GPN-loop GTPase 3 [Blattamonas nauphoetae]|uniref:GPN-loop GTPase 3 n=1 Tax=Blattamonas nauphoetae TaxID=2049346 RepID=A0ABQ9YE67_9EUKA|nr:putative GPN-loop GTPase 3 [Blattamonas nauphoetae]